jgi:hypothetical protein
MFKIFVLIAFIGLTGCQSVEEKNVELIQDRVAKLKPLTQFKPTWCRLETQLTQPALARYREMFPEEAEKIGEGTVNYTWKARKYNCEITPLDANPLTKNHQGFLDAAICTLLQVQWVNSPFEDLNIYPRDIQNEKGGTIHIQASMIDRDLGVYLDQQTFKMETRTKNRGTLKAVYTQVNQEWLPQRLEQASEKVRVVVDNIEYDTVPVSGRHLIKSLWISVGDGETHQHTQVNFTGCRGF